MVNLEELNPAQQSAVICCDAPSLVIAGAGSGKTRVLTYKIAWLMEQGMAPEHILALTFTNKAAKEMQERIALQVGAEKASRLWMGTFHSIFYRILRYEHELLGLSSNFTIYDQTDSKALIKTIVREMGLDEKVYKPGSVAGRISAAKNRLVMPEQYMASANTMNADRAAKVPATGEIYRRYTQRCRQAEAMDFDDLLLHTWLLFRDHPEVCRKYEERFQFVLVDEYQDTNYAQDQIVWQLTQHRQRVAVVGDDAQSIYSFRGANINNILRFRERYNGAKLFKLEQNYRSTQTIVNAASKLIAHNKGQIPKEVYSKKDVGDPIELMRCYSDIDEAGSVMKRIKELHNRKGFSFADIAILYRTNAQSRSFEEVLRKNAVPYRIYGGVSFYQRKEIKDAIAYFRLAVNPYDEDARAIRERNGRCVLAGGDGAKPPEGRNQPRKGSGRHLAAGKHAGADGRHRRIHCRASGAKPGSRHRQLSAGGFADERPGRDEQAGGLGRCRDDDDDTLGQGPGVQGGVRGWPGGRAFPFCHGIGNPYGDRGGAAPVLCGHDACGGGAGVHHIKIAFPLRQGGADAAVEIPSGDRHLRIAVEGDDLTARDHAEA